MSRLSRRRSKRPGESVVVDSNRRLPRAHESVRRFLFEELQGSDRSVGGVLRGLAPLSVAQRDVGLKQWVGVNRRSPTKRAFSKARYYNKLGALAIAAPSRVQFCVRRKVRREVLFAIRKVGRSGSSPGRYRRYRRTGDSRYSC